MKVSAVFLAVLACAAVKNVAGSIVDSRDVHLGTRMVKPGVFQYMDQPYCVVSNGHDNLPGEWTCVVTATKNHEGGAGEGVFALVSPDGGRTWEDPVPLEPEATAKKGGLANSYATIVASPETSSGSRRIFAMYTMNVDNITSLPNGAKLRRSDELGHFVFRFSDDGGRNWSKERFEVPYRTTSLDKGNSWKGAVRQMWCVDQTKVVGSTTFVAFTKIGTYIQNPPEEVWILSSDNLLTDGVKNASLVSWKLLPDGDTGLLPAAVSGPGDRHATAVMEEGHVLPLSSGHGWYAMARGAQGFLFASQTKDPTAATGWVTPSSYAQYFDNALSPLTIKPLKGLGSPKLVGAISTGLKNPRGPITPKKLQGHGGRYLLLYYNNANGGDFGRDPYWLSAGLEADGTILWSQPEVILYDRVIHTGTSGGGYPDILEGNGPDAGSVFITCTTKGGPPSQARVHKIDGVLLQGLLTQHSVSQIAGDRLALSLKPSDAGRDIVPLKGSVSLAPTFENYTQHSQGITVDLIATGFGGGKGHVLLEGKGKNDASVTLSMTAKGDLTVSISSGAWFNYSSANDATCARLLRTGGPSQSHFVAVTVDAGPLIATVMIDGVLCDGGVGAGGPQPFDGHGWRWVTSKLGSLETIRSVSVGTTVLGGHVYGRALRTSELVGNFRASSNETQIIV